MFSVWKYFKKNIKFHPKAEILWSPESDMDVYIFFKCTCVFYFACAFYKLHAISETHVMRF